MSSLWTNLQFVLREEESKMAVDLWNHPNFNKRYRVCPSGGTSSFFCLLVFPIKTHNLPSLDPRTSMQNPSQVAGKLAKRLLFFCIAPDAAPPLYESTRMEKRRSLGCIIAHPDPGCLLPQWDPRNKSKYLIIPVMQKAPCKNPISVLLCSINDTTHVHSNRRRRSLLQGLSGWDKERLFPVDFFSSLKRLPMQSWQNPTYPLSCSGKEFWVQRK